jgi:hypothetical protein
MQSDWKELIASLKSHGVEFLVVGAHALAVHARPRFTEDLDVFLRRTGDNRDRLADALSDFGLPVEAAALDCLFGEGRNMLVVGKKPFAVDFLNFIDGVTFDAAWNRKVEEQVLGEPAFVIGIEDYIATKRASGRPKDLADLALLSEALGREA